MQKTRKLTEHDLECLARSWITPAIAEAAGLFRVTTEEAQQYGFKFGARAELSGVCFKYLDPITQSVRGYRLRRDHPELERKDGELKPRAKYLSPPGQPNYLYFVPQAFDVTSKGDTSVNIVVVEGEKKALAVYRLATEGLGDSAESPRFHVIGISGAWSWRGKRGKEIGPDGHRTDVYDVISDLDRIEWLGRHVVLWPDSNFSTNASVRRGWEELSKGLKQKGAVPHFAFCPQEPALNGPDDYIAHFGAEWALERFRQALQSVESKGTKSPDCGSRIPKPASQSTRLLALADAAEVFHTSDGVGYARVLIDRHRETWPLKSSGFRRYLSNLLYQTERSATSTQALDDAIGELEAKAQFGAHEEQVFLRVGEYNGSLWLDLGDPNWSGVEVTPTGWRVVESPAVRFRRPAGTLPLPPPVRGGSLKEFKSFINVGSEADTTLIFGWMIGAMRPRGPYPILSLCGEQGTAKSSTSKVIRALIDPRRAPLRAAPRDERDLQISAHNSHIITIDNLSYLAPWLSDGLCRLATGGGLGIRKLYSDVDEIVFEAQRPILLNGIEEIGARGDFLERSILLNLPVIADTMRRDEDEFWKSFEAARPRLLGACLDAISVALKNVNRVRLERKPRMADFALWIVGAEPALPVPPATFLAAYTANLTLRNALAVETSLIAPFIVALLKDQTCWNGTASELLSAIDAFADPKITKGRGWPKSPRKLSGELRRLAPILRSTGISVIFDNREAGRRPIELRKENLLSESSLSMREEVIVAPRIPHENDHLSRVEDVSAADNFESLSILDDDESDGSDGCHENAGTEARFET